MSILPFSEHGNYFLLRLMSSPLPRCRFRNLMLCAVFVGLSRCACLNITKCRCKQIENWSASKFGCNHQLWGLQGQRRRPTTLQSLWPFTALHCGQNVRFCLRRAVVGQARNPQSTKHVNVGFGVLLTIGQPKNIKKPYVDHLITAKWTF